MVNVPYLYFATVDTSIKRGLESSVEGVAGAFHLDSTAEPKCMSFVLSVEESSTAPWHSYKPTRR